MMLLKEDKEQFVKVRQAFQNQRLRGWIPRYLLSVLEQDETEDTLEKLEQILPRYCVPRKFEKEEMRSLDEGSEHQDDWRSLLFELSPAVRTFWADRYKNYCNPNGKYQALLGFADMREKFLQASHESSAELLYSAGWKPIDTMCAYLLSMTTNRMYNLSPEAVRAAVRMDPEAAARLLDKKTLGEMIIGHHSSYQAVWQKMWMEFLYLFCDFTDQTFLYTEHKTKKLNQQCQTIREKLTCPDYERRRMEQTLRMYGLLPLLTEGEPIPCPGKAAALDKKFEKKQRLALLHAFVCDYQWSWSDWMEMKDLPSGRAAVKNLLWGHYRNGELQKAFAVREDGQTADEKKEAIFGDAFCKGEDRIGLVHPEELTEEAGDYWKKYAKKEKWKQPFSQLKIPVCQGWYDLSVFSGTQVTQLFMITAAGKWGLYQGSDKDKYKSYHMADLLHGYGAQLTFGGIWRGPEYGSKIITTEKVVFYRFRHFQVWEHVPESLILKPTELPPRFVSTALAAFRGIIGSGKKNI